MKGPAALVIVLILVSGCTEDDPDKIIVGTLERDRLELTAEANEPIVEVVIREGDHVDVGTPLLKLGDEAIQARLAQAMAQVSFAERRLAELVKGPRSHEIAEARAAADAALSAEQTSQNDFRRVQDLIKRALVSESELDAVRTQRDAAIAQRKQTSARLNLLLEGTRREEVEQAEAELKRAQAALAEVRTSASRYVVVAPRTGVIEALPFKLGERPPMGAPVVVMLADGTPYARVYVPEARRAHISSGSELRVTVDGVDRAFTGVARFISAQAQFTPYYALTQDDRSRLSYLAEIDLPEPEAAALPTGIPVQVALAQP